jgi:hypothetical protein
VPRAASSAALLLVFLLSSERTAAAQPVDPFERDVRTFEFAGNYLPEVWNKNLATDRLAGATFTAGASWAQGWQAVTEFALGRAMLGRGPDALYVGLAGGFRRHVVGRGRSRVFVDALFGFALANRHVPDRGTSFNWVAQGGGGFMRHLTDHVHLVTGMRVFHLSNAGMQGNDRNPDLEAIGGYGGVAFAF